MRNADADVKWLLMLDTEGLCSPERNDQEYDRKIVLFAMLSADLLIINTKDEIKSTMKDLIETGCISYHTMKDSSSCPKILYTFTQQAAKSNADLRKLMD